MTHLTDHGTAVQAALSKRFGISADAVSTLMVALKRGGMAQAQFSHPELGGMGQWSAGGMTMIGDMFNTDLRGRVGDICSEIAKAADEGQLFDAESRAKSDGDDSPSGAERPDWWPSGLGVPSSTGSQNSFRYAVFPESRRLAVSRNGTVTLYDTGDHVINGVSQQQSGQTSWSFTSQSGTVGLEELPKVPLSK